MLNSLLSLHVMAAIFLPGECCSGTSRIQERLDTFCWRNSVLLVTYLDSILEAPQGISLFTENQIPGKVCLATHNSSAKSTYVWLHRFHISLLLKKM